MSQLRVLHAPTDVGNQAWGLSLGERHRGLASEVMIYELHFPGFSFDHNLHFETKSRPHRLASAMQFFLRSLSRYDIFHFYFATTFFPRTVDLPILAALNKKIFFTFQGCDIRPTPACAAARISPTTHRHAPMKAQQQHLQHLLSYASGSFVLNPDLLDPSPTSTYLPYAIDINNLRPTPPSWDGKGDVIIFHAPSDRLVKGTDYLVAAVDRLRQQGYPVRLDIAHKVSNTEVRKRAGVAHIVVDQLLIGWYGALAVETMALGKPTICFLDARHRKRVWYENEIPILNADPESIERVLRELLEQPNTWRDIGERSRAFVEHIHAPEKVADIVIREYQTRS